jgi:transcriptional regulator with XRE-family HTH domain
LTMIKTDRLNQAIEESGLRLDYIIEKSGLSRQTIYLMREGKANNPQIETLAKLARVLGIPVSELINEEAA